MIRCPPRASYYSRRPSDDADTADVTLKQLKELQAAAAPDEENQTRQMLLETQLTQLKLEYAKAGNQTGDAGSGGDDVAGVFDAAVQAVSARIG